MMGGAGWRMLVLLAAATGLQVVAMAAPPASAPVSGEPCGPYRVGLREYPRLYQRDAKGGYEGLDKEFFEALSERSGCPLEYQLESQPRLWQKIRAGQIDLAAWVVQTDERAPLVSVIPLMTSRLMAVTWRDAPAPTQTQLGFLADPSLLAVRIRQSTYGPGYDELLQQLHDQGRLSEVADFETALRLFSMHRVALVFAYPWSLMQQPPEWMAQVRLTDWQPQAPGLPSGLAISRRTISVADAQRLEDALRAMQRDGSLARIVAHHLPMDWVKVLPAPR